MPSTILLALAIAAVATGSVAGGLTLADMSEFDLELKVVDASTGGPVVGASVDIKDANSQLVAQGLTNEDGEFEVEVDDHGADDHEDQTNESPEEIEDEDEATLNNIVGPLTITISKEGYVTQTFTVDVNTLHDGDYKVELQPAA